MGIEGIFQCPWGVIDYFAANIAGADATTVCRGTERGKDVDE